MKQVLIVTFFTLTTGLSYAQDKPVIIYDRNRSMTVTRPSFPDNQQMIVDTGKLRQLLLQGRKDNGNALAMATFSHNTSRGAVYKLPVDNMPCLVPDMRQVTTMPNKQSDPAQHYNMPNLYKPWKVVPDAQQVTPDK